MIRFLFRPSTLSMRWLTSEAGTKVESNGRFYECLQDNQQKYSRHLLMARVGDFYEFYFDQAEKVSRALGLKLAQGKYRGKEHVFCGFPSYKMNDYVRMLLGHGFTIAKYEQYESLQLNGQRIMSRKVDRIFSAGTVTEEELTAEGEPSKYVLALTVDKRQNDVYGFSAVDISSGKFISDITTLHNLPHVLSALDLSEIIVSCSDAADKNLSAVFERFGLSTQTIDNVHFCSDNAWEHLTRMFTPSAPTQNVARQQILTSIMPAKSHSHDASLRSIGAILSYISESHGGLLPYLETPSLFNKPRLKIDLETEKSLELVSSIRGGSRKGSLFDTIDMTITPVGRKELLSRLKAPFHQKSVIDANLDLVDLFIRNDSLLTGVRKVISSYFKHDTLRSLQNLKLNHAGLWHLGCIYEAISGYKMLQKVLSSYPSLRESCEHVLKMGHKTQNVNMDGLTELSDLLEAVMPEDFINGTRNFATLPKKLDGVGNLNPPCNTELLQASKQYYHAIQQRDNLATFVKETYFPDDNAKIKLINKKPLGSIIEIHACKEALDKLEDSQDFIRVQALRETSKTMKRRYTYRKWSELEHRVNSTYLNYSQVETKAFRMICQHIETFRNDLVNISNLVALLDVSGSFAKKAVESNYFRPVIHEEPIFSVKAGRHPVVEDYLQISQKAYTPNSCVVADTKRSHMMFITGPNMGGKSTYLRMNALFIVLSHIGSYVPASEAHIGIVDQLFSRVGTSDNLSQNESSFMVEMKETAFILQNATKNSFAILDEVGRGTSYDDGVSLAAGIVQYLSEEVKCRALFATHYTELGHSIRDDHVIKYRSKIHTKEGNEHVPLFTYQFEPGVSDNSFGLYIAQIAGIRSNTVI